MLKPYPSGGTPSNGPYGKAPPERGTFFRLQVFRRVVISQVEVYLTIRPVARKGYGSIAHEAKPNGLLTRGP